MPIRILIADDHAVVRQGLRFLLSQQPDIEVVGEAENGATALAIAQQELPDVVLLDLLMPEVDGLTTLKEIKQSVPITRVIILTSYFEDDQIFNAVKGSATAYLLKDSSPQEIIAAVHAAANGETTLSPRIAARVLQEMRTSSSTPLDTLTPRELDVLTLIARGRSNREIALELTVSEQTVKTHVSNTLSKLHLADRTQAAIYALQQRLVPLDSALDKQDV